MDEGDETLLEEIFGTKEGEEPCSCRYCNETGDEQMEETLTYYGVRLTKKCWLRKEMQNNVGYWVVVSEPGEALWWDAKAKAEPLAKQYGGEVVEMRMALGPKPVLTENTGPGIVTTPSERT